ncbi:hypothetical protein [Lysobacter sp. yr284]|uniref:hypothetical protein n=1 Tax=Lysobacter sp. yr284 TaxID=1761791 RepID=UPI0011140439|nr:hypothetical protein [Lysobacter sp. yr284]
MKKSILSSLVILMAAVMYLSFREAAPMPNASVRVEVGDSLEKFKSAQISGAIGPADVACTPAQTCMVMKTFDPQVTITGGDARAIDGVRYFGVQSENGLITQVDGGTSLLTLDEAIARHKEWAAEFEGTGG